jgi:hypothetical protein
LYHRRRSNLCRQWLVNDDRSYVNLKQRHSFPSNWITQLEAWSEFVHDSALAHRCCLLEDCVPTRHHGSAALKGDGIGPIKLPPSSRRHCFPIQSRTSSNPTLGTAARCQRPGTQYTGSTVSHSSSACQKASASSATDLFFQVLPNEFPSLQHMVRPP